MLVIVRNILLMLLSVGLQAGWSKASATDYNLTYSGSWRNTDDVVNGWDWTLPPRTRPAPHSGIYNYNSNVPEGFSGNHLKLVNYSWRDIEPTKGVYDFSAVIADINDPTYDGAMLNIRGMVWTVNGSSTARTAPDWLAGSPTIAEGIGDGSGDQITHLKISDPKVKNAFVDMIKAFGKAGISANPKLKAAILHGVSSSLGEEWTGRQASMPETEAAMADIIRAWAAAYDAPASGNYAYKLGWMKPGDLNDLAISLGSGSRGGKIESWLRYTPEPDLGQSWDANGYLITDETIPEIAKKRHFGDQNETYKPGQSNWLRKFGAESFWPLRYRMANLRSVQMRRNILWLERDSYMNPPMFNWMGLQLGQITSTAPDAWVALIRSWSRHQGQNRPVNNFERGLYQRESTGSTRPTVNRPHGYNASGNRLLPESYWNVDIARRPTTSTGIGITVDNEFLATPASHNVAIKVTFMDTGTDSWTLSYRKRSAGNLDAKDVTKENSGKVRTATFFIPDFFVGSSSGDATFHVKGMTTDFMFVRLIKMSSGSSAGPGPSPEPPPGTDPTPPPPPPTPPQDLQIVP